MSTRKTTEEKIEAAKIEKEQAEARIKKLLQIQKTEERKARNHRLCERGGKVEKLLPGLAMLTEAQFEVFVKKTLLTSYTKSVLDELLPPESTAPAVADAASRGAGDAAAQSTAETVRSSSAPTPKVPETAHSPVTGGNNRPTQSFTPQGSNVHAKPAETTTAPQQAS